MEKEGKGAYVLPWLCMKVVMEAEETAEDIQSHLLNPALVITGLSRAVIQSISFARIPYKCELDFTAASQVYPDIFSFFSSLPSAQNH